MIGDKIDNASGAAVVINVQHHNVHIGNAFVLARPRTLPVGNDEEILIEVPDTTKWAHINFSVVSDAAITLDLYETTTMTVGTELVPRNRNRNSDVESGLTITHTPGGSGDGTLIFSWKAGANIPVGAGAEGQTRNEFILKQGTKYLLRASGTSGDVITLVLDWYELVDVV